MARRVRRGAPPPVAPPYYAEGELVRERTVITESAATAPLPDDRSGLLWLLLLPAIALLLVIAYYLSQRNHDPATVTQPSPVASPVASAAPTVVINQPAPAAPPVVIVQQPPAQQPAPQQSPAATQAAPSPS